MNKNFLIGVLLFVIILLGIKILVFNMYFGKMDYSNTKNRTETTTSIESEAYKKYAESVKEALKTTSGPIAIFDPNITLEEKKDLQTKILNPYSAFHAPKGTKAFVVYKMSEEDRNKSGAPASYQISAINNDGSTEEWLAGKTGAILEYWIPSCLGDCKFTPSFQKDYPEVVKRYDEIALDQK